MSAPRVICIAVMSCRQGTRLEVVWRKDGRSDFRSHRIGASFVRYPSSKI